MQTYCLKVLDLKKSIKHSKVLLGNFDDGDFMTELQH